MPVYDKKSVKEVQDYLDALAKIPEEERKAYAKSGERSKGIEVAWKKLTDSTKVIVTNIQQLAESTEEVDIHGEKLSISFIKMRDQSRGLAEVWKEMPDKIAEVTKKNGDWGKTLNNIVKTQEVILESGGDHSKFTEKQIKEQIQIAKHAQDHLQDMFQASEITHTQLVDLQGISAEHREVFKSMGKQKRNAKAIASATKLAGFDVMEMKDNLKKLLTPMGAFLALITLVSKTLNTMIDDAVSLNAELGIGLWKSMKQTDLSAKGILSSIIGVRKNINEAGAATALMAGSLKAGKDEALNVNRAAAALDFQVSVQELAALEETLFTAADMTREMAAQAVNATQAFALANDVAPKAVLQDMASNAEMLAKYSDGTAEGMAKAAVYAQKLGLNLSKVSRIADGLLDLESSMNAEFEASILLNRDLNFDRARTLALNNDITGAVEDIVSQIGGEAEFARMNAIQRQALAGAIGVSADELANMMKKGADAGIKDDFTKFENQKLKSDNELIALTAATNGWLKTLIVIMGAFVAFMIGKDIFGARISKMLGKRRGTTRKQRKMEKTKAKAQKKINKDATKSAKKQKVEVDKKVQAKADKSKIETKKMNDKLQKGKAPKAKSPKLDVPISKSKGIVTGAGKEIAASGLKGAGASAGVKVAESGLKVAGEKTVIKTTEKQIAKNLAKAGSKGLLKTGLKKIPILGLLFAAGFAGSRAMKGDWTGAGLELLSGGASIFPGAGTAASFGIDASIAAMDMKRAGIIGGKAMGGPVTDSGTYMVGEMGPELVNLPKGANVYSNDQLAGAMRDGNASLADIGPLVEELRQLRTVMKDVATNTGATSAGVNKINISAEA